MLRPRIASRFGFVYFSRIRYSAGGDEIVEHVLLPELRAGLVPVLAVFAAAAQVGHGVDAAHLEPRLDGRAERGRRRDIEAAVAVQQHGLVAVALRSPCGA